MNTFIIRDESIRERALELVKNIDLGATVKVTTTPCARSTQQNNTFHMWCEDMAQARALKSDTGQPLTAKQIKIILKQYYCPKEKVVDSKGNEYSEPISTAELEKEQFSEFMAKVQITASYYNITLRDPSTHGLEWR